MYKGWKLLTKKERKHLAAYKKQFTWQLKEIFAAQKEQRDLALTHEPCWECKQIAQKLGYPV